MADTSTNRSSKASVALAWLIVVLPLSWGLTYTVTSALKIFSAPPPASAQPAPR